MGFPEGISKRSASSEATGSTEKFSWKSSWFFPSLSAGEEFSQDASLPANPFLVIYMCEPKDKEEEEEEEVPSGKSVASPPATRQDDACGSKHRSLHDKKDLSLGKIGSASLILLQNTPPFSDYCCSLYSPTMTTRPSRKAPSSLLLATKASSARTRSSSCLARAKSAQDTSAKAMLDAATPSVADSKEGNAHATAWLDADNAVKTPPNLDDPVTNPKIPSKSNDLLVAGIAAPVDDDPTTGNNNGSTEADPNLVRVDTPTDGVTSPKSQAKSSPKNFEPVDTALKKVGDAHRDSYETKTDSKFRLGAAAEDGNPGSSQGFLKAAPGPSGANERIVDTAADLNSGQGIVTSKGCKVAGKIDAHFPSKEQYANGVLPADEATPTSGNSVMTNTSPPPKNLYSIFASKMPSKAPTLILLGNTRPATKTPVTAMTSLARPTIDALDSSTTVNPSAIEGTPSVATNDLVCPTSDALKSPATAPPSVIDGTPSVSASVVTGVVGAEARTAADILPKVTNAIDATDIGTERPTSAKSMVLVSGTSMASSTVCTLPAVGPPIDAPSKVVDPNRDGLAVNFVGKAGGPGVGPGLDNPTAVTPSVFDSISNNQTGGKPGLQPHSKAPLPTHTQTPTPTPTLGVPGASAIIRIGTGPSDALGNTDTRANASNKSDIESTSVSFKSLSTDKHDVLLGGSPEDPHTSDLPIYSVEDKLSGEALQHAFNVGTIEGIVPHGVKAYDPKLHGEDMDLYRSAYALGYRHQDYSEPTTPKHFMDALQVGYVSERHKAMGGLVMYLKAICAGFCPGLDGSPKVFLKQHAKGKLPAGSGWSSPITPQEFREQMVVEVCPLPVNAGAKQNSSGAVTRHFVAPSGPEFDAEAMGLTVDLTGTLDSDDDMDAMEAAEAKAMHPLV